MGASLLHNMWLREGILAAVVVIVLISFYVRYQHAAHREYVRTRERRMTQVVHSARRQLVVAVLLLAAVVVYDRVLPQFGVGATSQREAQSSSSRHTAKKTQAKHLQAAKSVSKEAASLSASASRSAAKSSSAAKASSVAKASSANAASAKAASAAASSVDPKQQAVSAVQAYWASHPDQQDTRVDNVGVIEYGTDYNGNPAYQVGLYQTQADDTSVAVHMYFYYPNGIITKAY